MEVGPAPDCSGLESWEWTGETLPWVRTAETRGYVVKQKRPMTPLPWSTETFSERDKNSPVPVKKKNLHRSHFLTQYLILSKQAHWTGNQTSQAKLQLKVHQFNPSLISQFNLIAEQLNYVETGYAPHQLLVLVRVVHYKCVSNPYESTK